MELISHYDPILEEHLNKVKTSQNSKCRLQVHYLSPESQNEFIKCCADKVTECILKEQETAKYYSIIVDPTPDSSHIEQTVFVLHYVHLNAESDKYLVMQRFLEFVDCNRKTEEAIAQLILDTLTKHNIPIADCCGQGYDNGSNMSGSYKGAQAHIQQINPLAKFVPCACHSLNLCGVHAAECCPEVITFFGVVQKLYNIFSSSQQRWEILTKSIGCSLHNLSDTRWSARVDSVRPFAAHLPGIKKAIVLIQELNLTAEIRSELHGIQIYLDSFESILMASIWFKVLTAINFRSTVLQARNATLDAEVDNIQSLIQDLKHLRDSWDTILAESKLVAGGLNVRISLTMAEKRRRVRKRFPDDTQEEDIEFDPENHFKHHVFYTLLDCVIGNLTTHYEAAKELVVLFGFVWAYQNMDEELRSKAKALCEKYSADISEDFVTEMLQKLSTQPISVQKRVYLPLIC